MLILRSNSKKISAGFTLIELLVVVAIIGILSSVILVWVSTARGKGNDAKVKSQLASLKRTTEIYSAGNGDSYGVSVSCAAGMFADVSSDTAKFVTAANYPVGTTFSCQSSASAWAVSASLATAGQYWCVDSVGKSKLEASAVASTVCP